MLRRLGARNQCVVVLIDLLAVDQGSQYRPKYVQESRLPRQNEAYRTPEEVFKAECKRVHAIAKVVVVTAS